MTSSAKNVLIIGATSAIARATAECCARDGHHLYLLARNAERLESLRTHLEVTGAASVHAKACTLTDVGLQAEILKDVRSQMPQVDMVLLAYGSLSEQAACAADAALTATELHTNFVSATTWLTELANLFAAQGHGSIAVISSVAGDRGRPSNYVYGSAKAGLSAFLQGLRARLFKKGVAVVTIKPGFVDTPMTAHVPKNPLFASPQAVGKRIYRAMLRGERVVYVPGFWRYIMLIVRSIPEVIFNRLSL